MADRRGIL